MLAEVWLPGTASKVGVWFLTVLKVWASGHLEDFEIWGVS